MMRGALAAALLVGTAAAALAQTVPAQGRVRAQHASVQCPLAGPVERQVLRVFDNAAQWQAEIAASERDLFRHGVPWSDARVVVYALERQPTLGVSVELEQRDVTVRRGVLRLPVRIQRPAPGQFAATALSRPCLIVVVDRKGWREAEVTGARKRVLATGRVSTSAPDVRAMPKAPDMRDVVTPAAPAASR